MKRILMMLAAAVCLCSCAAEVAPPSALYPESCRPGISAEVTQEEQRAVWLPYMQFADHMQGKSAEEFRMLFREKLNALSSDNVNTLYIHVHPCGDAYYRSDIFPPGTYLDGDYDPLAIMLEEAHSAGMAVHGWLNPLRCQTEEQMAFLPDDFIVKQWTKTGQAKMVSGRWYLDPSYPEVTQLIADCADELLEHYDLDGLHIDDYFYPASDPEFDRTEFEKSGADDLSRWRMENCDRFVKALYDTAHAHGVPFGISPQGNISANYSSQFADVKLWAGKPGYCDYIVPQLYFGFLNETCPFEPTLREWEEITCPEVSLIIGLAGYKQGAEDKWAGQAGLREWVDDPELLQKQIRMVEDSTADGYAVY